MRIHAFILATILALALSGCIEAQPDDVDEAPRNDAGDDAPTQECTPPDVTPKGPSGGQSGVSNEPGSFTYGGRSAAKSETEVFLWENPSSAADITWGGQSAAGSVTLTLQDHCGSEVYARDFGGASQQGGASESSAPGEPGTWIVTLEFTVYTGQMGLTITSA